MALGPGTILMGKYRIVSRLGSGGMGTVWEAVDLNLERKVAIKVMLSDNGNPEAFRRFQREARLAARLQHPGITVVHDSGRDGDQFFIVMELLQGTDLSALLRNNPKGLPADRVVRLAARAADALAEAHKNGVVHRDIKPANLMVLANDRLKVCDFGIAKSDDATSELTKSNEVIGTFRYMAPERWRSQPADARSDLYSLGCVLYAMLSGQPPFGEGLDMPTLMSRHLNDIPPAPQGIDATPAALRDLVMRLLAKDPGDRPASAAQVATELRGIRFTPTVRAAGKPGYASPQAGPRGDGLLAGGGSAPYWPGRYPQPEHAPKGYEQQGYGSPGHGANPQRSREAEPIQPRRQPEVTPWPEPEPWPGDVEPEPASKGAPPFTWTSQALALVVALTTTVICFSPLWGLESAWLLLLEIPGVFCALVGLACAFDLEGATSRHPGWQLFLASLGLSAGEAGLLLFATGTWPLILCAIAGGGAALAGVVTICVVQDSVPQP